MYTLDKTIDIFTLYLSLSIVIGQNDKDNDTVWRKNFKTHHALTTTNVSSLIYRHPLCIYIYI